MHARLCIYQDGMSHSKAHDTSDMRCSEQLNSRPDTSVQCHIMVEAQWFKVSGVTIRRKAGIDAPDMTVHEVFPATRTTVDNGARHSFGDIVVRRIDDVCFNHSCVGRHRSRRTLCPGSTDIIETQAACEYQWRSLRKRRELGISDVGRYNE